MTEILMIVTDSNNQSLEQTLKNPRPFSDMVIQDEIDAYINEYIKAFNSENVKNGTYLKSLKMYYDNTEIRSIQKNKE